MVNMKTLLKIQDFAANIIDKLLTDPLNSKICLIVIKLAGAWIGCTIGWAIYNKFFEL
jgi:hypothetical protein